MLERKLDEALKQNQAYFDEFSESTQRFEKEKNALQKKVNDSDRRIEAVVISFEEKLEVFLCFSSNFTENFIVT